MILLYVGKLSNQTHINEYFNNNNHLIFFLKNEHLLQNIVFRSSYVHFGVVVVGGYHVQMTIVHSGLKKWIIDFVF